MDVALASVMPLYRWLTLSLFLRKPYRARKDLASFLTDFCHLQGALRAHNVLASPPYLQISLYRKPTGLVTILPPPYHSQRPPPLNQYDHGFIAPKVIKPPQGCDHEGRQERYEAYGLPVERSLSGREA